MQIQIPKFHTGKYARPLKDDSKKHNAVHNLKYINPREKIKEINPI
jgi:hypothetical protein